MWTLNVIVSSYTVTVSPSYYARLVVQPLDSMATNTNTWTAPPHCIRSRPHLNSFFIIIIRLLLNEFWTLADPWPLNCKATELGCSYWVITMVGNWELESKHKCNKLTKAKRNNWREKNNNTSNFQFLWAMLQRCLWYHWQTFVIWWRFREKYFLF